jgi:hypothetical protein
MKKIAFIIILLSIANGFFLNEKTEYLEVKVASTFVLFLFGIFIIIKENE